ncbi:MAG: flippase [Nitrospirae bacterium]|nr:MAG: flippase [Nitrospirota bacterium]
MAPPLPISSSQLLLKTQALQSHQDAMRSSDPHPDIHLRPAKSPNVAMVSHPGWPFYRPLLTWMGTQRRRMFPIHPADQTVATGALCTLALKIMATGLGVLATLVIARILDAKGYGTFTYAMAWISVLLIPATFGFDTLLVRQLAAYASQSDWGLMRGLLRRTHQVVLAISLGIGTISGSVLWIMANHLDAQLLFTMGLGCVLLPLMALNGLRQAAMQGLHRVVTGQIPGTVIQPLLLLGLVCASYLILGLKLSAPVIMGLVVISACVTYVIGTQLLSRAIPTFVERAQPTYRTAQWSQAALPLALLTGLHVVNSQTDVIMLGAIHGVEQAGVYSVASRGAELILFPLVAANMALGPKIAVLHAEGKLHRLQQLVTASARGTFVLACPIALAFLFSGDWFLFLFGPHFLEGTGALRILSVGQLTNVFMGSVGLLLIMTGYERDAARGMAMSAGLNIFLNAMWIPMWGIHGAAWATAMSLITWKVFLIISVYKRLHINTTALGIINKAPQ